MAVVEHNLFFWQFFAPPFYNDCMSRDRREQSHIFLLQPKEDRSTNFVLVKGSLVQGPLDGQPWSAVNAAFCVRS